MKDHPDASRQGRIVRVRSHEAAPTVTVALSASFLVHTRHRGSLFAALPHHLVLEPAAGARVHEQLRPFVSLLQRELEEEQPGVHATTTRLAESLFIAALRVSGAAGGSATSLLRGLADRQLARAIHAMHQSPAQKWTGPALARQAGMSRSAFAAHFLATVGMTPHDYLTAWRIERATRHLRETDATVQAIAAEVGFASESSFSRRFSALVGASPGRYRRRQTSS